MIPRMLSSDRRRAYKDQPTHGATNGGTDSLKKKRREKKKTV